MAMCTLQPGAQTYVILAMYYAHISQKGPVKYDDIPGSIGVLESPDNHMPTGISPGLKILPDLGDATCRESGGSTANWKTLQASGIAQTRTRHGVARLIFRPT
jgi:hypothetical protein